MGGFLTTLSRYVSSPECGSFPQVICYERADDMAFGVSGVVTKARGIGASFPDLDPSQIPMATAMKCEKVLYLLDPVRVSRSPALRTRTNISFRAGAGGPHSTQN
jgi:electron-transferring-flavoprotein dehydrogenase